MENKQIITLAYELAKTKYKNKAFTFEALWKELTKKARLDKDEQAQAGLVYATMLQDRRFIFVGNQQWQIREFLTQEEQNKFSNALFDFNLVVEEEGEEAKEAKKKQRLASISDKEQAEQEMYYDETDLEQLYKESSSAAFDDEEEGDEEDGEEIEEKDSDDEEVA